MYAQVNSRLRETFSLIILMYTHPEKVCWNDNMQDLKLVVLFTNYKACKNTRFCISPSFPLLDTQI